MAFTIGGVVAFMATGLGHAVRQHVAPADLTGDELAMLAHRTRNYNSSAAVFRLGYGLATGFGFWAACRGHRAFLWDLAMPSAHVFLYRMTGGEQPDAMWAIPAFFMGLIERSTGATSSRSASCSAATGCSPGTSSRTKRPGSTATG